MGDATDDISIYQDIGNAHYEGQVLSDLADTYAAVGDLAASDVRHVSRPLRSPGGRLVTER